MVNELRQAVDKLPDIDNGLQVIMSVLVKGPTAGPFALRTTMPRPTGIVITQCFGKPHSGSPGCWRGGGL